ncbi:hypothetical protein GOP47_0001041 [Adiantum capillus-veneris]|uniref:RNA helicase n=2 Tax=Adiantum capillus-veneris TaxID=13818 RepID=A0A9D4VEM4_ADICA|nr:hypothetical protein GOP47_0001041 [Adiantum capillus-veneris]
MERGLLGSGPAADNNKRKRDAKSQYITSMMQGNPKMLLAASPIFRGILQQQLPFSVASSPSFADPLYEARIKLPLPDGREAWGTGSARTKKEAERIAAVDACKKLNELDFLVGDYNSNATPSADVGWGENPKNILIRSASFRSVCCGPNAKPLPISLRSSGPDHLKVFVAELVVPIPGKANFIAVGEGRNKGEAERACCYSACEKLQQEGLLHKPGDAGAAPAASFSKALHMQQKSEHPAIVGLRDEELALMEDALHRLHLEMENDFAQRQCQLPPDEAQDLLLQKEVFNLPSCYSNREYLNAESAALCQEARNRLSSSLLTEQRQVRQSLPLWRQRQKIVDMIAKNQVIVLTGETGSGKTTQVPQFVLEDHELNGTGAEVRIVVTQPRRIAAISVAERVAWERGELLGKSVGYSIRLESVPPRPRGSILYCTTGILLRRLQGREGVSGITHIIIDEVHERDLETDFLLIVVRELLQNYPSIRVVIMSATVDSSIYTRYFDYCPAIAVPGMMHPVQVYYLEDLPSLMGQYSFIVPKFPKARIADDEEVDVDLIANVISWIAEAFAQTDGAILCFLPGLDHIIMVKERLLKMPGGRRLMILPLHSQIPAGEQRSAFARAPIGLRKVVLATNIAETSVTIDDVVYVVDSGKMKEKQYNPALNMNILRVQWTSQASARQRQGRAGRVRAGFCFRMYTSQVFGSMLEHQIPEMQRVPLEELCLQIKALAIVATETTPSGGPSKHSNIVSFLLKALQPPNINAVHAAIRLLQDLGAIDHLEDLTSLGMILAKLAVPPRFGKMLIYGALLGCLEPVLTMAAAACFRDPFVAPINKRDEADRMRESFSVGLSYGSDQLALVNAFEQWAAASLQGQGLLFCEQCFLAPITMKLIAGMRQQLKKTLAEAGIQEQSIRLSVQASIHVARSLLVAGLYPNIASSEFCRESRGIKHAPRWRLGFKVRNDRVLIHPTSVITEKQLNPESHYYLVFQEKVQTSQVFVRGCTLLPPLPVALLSWKVNLCSDPVPPELPGDWMVLEVEGWLKFLIDRRCGHVLLQLREAFHRVLGKWVSGGVHKDAESYIIRVAMTLLEATCNDMFIVTP